MLVSGCLPSKRADYTSSRLVSVSDRSEQADQWWEAIQDTLRDSRFAIDRVDRRAGVVTTFPVGSQHFFEFWRHDVDTREDFWEATLNPIRRWVEVNVKQSSAGEWEELSFTVRTQRLSARDRQFNRTGAAYQFFGYNFPATTGEPDIGPNDVRWMNLGRDPAMEEYLLDAFVDRTGMSVSPDGV